MDRQWAMMILSYILLGGMALLMIWQDLRYQMIPAWCLLLFALISGLHLYFEPNPDGLWVAGIILIIFSGCQLFFSLFLRKLAMGWGDMILGPACGVWIYAHELPYFLLSTGFIGLIMGLFWYYRWGNRTYPFMPSILGGLGVILLIRCFLKSDGL